ncbi:DMT family transporter [Sphingobium fuliginis]|jgi:drug/metabolite transporter (DMT)-like permease|uniref:DMT family transporter n=1 Tax=Sphingobium fuliginis (strain ATCC 27551) TaxID=336203 RepID=A0A292ZAM5_SPHSA|nr:DMT family transporter [Sphingobium fuliginis]QOT71375.1 DMT family transporter [Sphingobium fuliginis]GAY19880.1 phosphatidate cytidylyltransferase [Sphingobium fuliginis]
MAFPIWLPATLLAGATQAWRTAVQRRVSKELSVNAAGLVRYLYGLPFALMLLAGYRLIYPGPLPSPDPSFLLFCLGGGLAQIVATNLLIMAFAHRNFVVGTAYSKTEAVQGAILSFLLMGERLPPLAWAGIGCGVAGIMLLSVGGKKPGFLRALGQPAALCGIASGFFFALTAIAIRRGTQEVDAGGANADPVLAALIVLVVTVAMQTVMQGGFLLLREPGEMRKVLHGWRISGQVGLLSALGSACWFTGFATAPVALVRIVGQVEVAFTLGFGHFYLGERMKRSEVMGLVLVATGVVLALTGAL